MRALTLHRPWARAVFRGKKIENRPWPAPSTLESGAPLAISAGRTWDQAAADHLRVELGSQVVDSAKLQRTGIIGAVRFVGCLDPDRYDHEDLPEPYRRWAQPGAFHWILTPVLVELEEPIPCGGSLGLWTLPEEVEAKLLAQIGGQVE